MLSNELEYCLNEHFQNAREARHEFMTVEYLLLAIIDTPKIREILRACALTHQKLRNDLKASSTRPPRASQGRPTSAKCSRRSGFQRVLQRAVAHN